MRNQLERVIAYYIATKQRKKVRDTDSSHDMLLLDIADDDSTYKLKQLQRNTVFIEQMDDFEANINSSSSTGGSSSDADSNFKKMLKYINRQISYVSKVIYHEFSGSDYVDAIDYNIRRLQELNIETKELQDKLLTVSKQADVEVQKKIKMKHDTRAALVLSALGNNLKKDTNFSSLLDVFNLIESDDRDGPNSTTSAGGGGISASNSMNHLSSLDSNKSLADMTHANNNIRQKPSADVPTNNHIINNLENDETKTQVEIETETMATNTNQPTKRPIASSQKVFAQAVRNVMGRKNQNQSSTKTGKHTSDERQFLKSSRIKKEAIEQVKITTTGAFKGVIELERSLEMVLFI